MEIPTPKYQVGDSVVAKRARYSPDDPYIEYEGKIVSVCYNLAEDEEYCNVWEYEICFPEPDAKGCFFYGWWIEENIPNIKWEHN